MGFPAQENLEQTLLALAEELPDAAWQSSLWSEFLEVVEYGTDGEWELFDDELAALAGSIETIWEEYSSMQFCEQELTLETALGHQLFSEGLQSWAEAIDQLRLAAEDSGSIEEALELAESGSRLLAILSVHADRVSCTFTDLRRAS